MVFAGLKIENKYLNTEKDWKVPISSDAIQSGDIRYLPETGDSQSGHRSEQSSVERLVSEPNSAGKAEERTDLAD